MIENEIMEFRIFLIFIQFFVIDIIEYRTNQQTLIKYDRFRIILRSFE